MTRPDYPSSGHRIGSRTAIAATVVVALVVVAFAVGRSSKSPAQVAATAAAPALSTITAPVDQKVLAQTTVFRGDVGPTSASGVEAPQLPSGSQPVVTSTEAHQGDKVDNGGVLASIAGRPIFILQGTVPAFRTMQYGDSGIDVAQLQQALLALGYGVGSDSSGVFGTGTSRSVRWLYNHAGYSPLPGPSLPSNSSTSTPASSTGSSTQDAPATPAPDPTWSVNYGEVVFVANVPANVSVDTLTVGQTINASASASSPNATAQGPSTPQPILTLGSGGIEVTGQIAATSATSIRKGMPVQLDDDATGGSWKGTVATVTTASGSSDSSGGVPQATIVIAPDADAGMPTSEIGQNIRVTVTSARTKSKVLVVPIAAVYSRPDGRTYVRVVSEKTKREVPVTVGLDSSGNIEVTPVGSAHLKAGNNVVIGSTKLAGQSGS